MLALEVTKPFMTHFQVLAQYGCARIRSGERGGMNTPADKPASHSEEGRCTDQQIQEEGENVARRVEHKEDVCPQELSGNPEVSAESGVNRGNGTREDDNTTERWRQ